MRSQSEWKRYMREITAFLTYCWRSEPEIGSRQIQYIEEFDHKLSHFWQVRSLETRSKAYGKALGDYTCHWASSVLSKISPTGPTESYEDLISTLAARSGLSGYVRHRQELRDRGLIDKSDVFYGALEDSSSSTLDAECAEPYATESNSSVEPPSPKKDKPRSHRRHKDRPSLSVNGIVLSRPTELPSSTIVLASQTLPCPRCKAFDELTKIGFKPEEIHEAMEKAGVGTYVPGLVAWIVDLRSKIVESIPQTLPALAEARPSQVNKPKATRSEQNLSPESQARQWSVVVKNAGRQKESDPVVGAQWVTKPTKQNVRRKKVNTPVLETTPKVPTEPRAGEIAVDGGTFTWFYEPTDQSRRDWSEETMREFQELVESFFTQH